MSSPSDAALEVAANVEEEAPAAGPASPEEDNAADDSLIMELEEAETQVDAEAPTQMLDEELAAEEESQVDAEAPTQMPVMEELESSHHGHHQLAEGVSGGCRGSHADARSVFT